MSGRGLTAKPISSAFEDVFYKDGKARTALDPNWKDFHRQWFLPILEKLSTVSIKH